MDIKKYFKIALGVTLATTIATSCVQKDDWETPELKCENRFGEPNKTMAEVAALAPNSGYFLIDDNLIFDGYVVSSDEGGNFYKTISFQDSPVNPTIGLEISVDKSDNYADYPVGTHIRINAKGLRIAKDRGIIKLGSVDNQYAIGRIPSALLPNYVSGVCSSNGGLDVQQIVPKELANLQEAKQPQYINTLVTVPKVQFDLSLLNPEHKKYVDIVGGEGQNTNREIQDEFGNTTIVRTSGFADFKNELLPQGSGRITFVVSTFNNDRQMILRDLKDVEISDDLSTRFIFDETPPKGGAQISYNGSFTENFESYGQGWTTLSKYINDVVVGENNRYWIVATYNNNKYLQASAHQASGVVKTSFAMPVDFTAANSLSFDVKFGYMNGQPLKVYLSTDYTMIGGIDSATLVDITNEFTYPTAPSNGFGTNFENAGTYNFPSNLTGNGYIIFVYEGKGNNPNKLTTTAQLDNIVVQ